MASLAKNLRDSIERISIKRKFYAAIAGLVALIFMLVGLSVYSQRQQAAFHEQLDITSQAAVNVERANGLIFAVVMESRGVYMSSEAPTVKRYGDAVLRRNRELANVLTDWERIVRDDDVELFAAFKARILDFIRFREELVRRAVNISQKAGREWGDNEANRSVRTALNEDLAALATIYFKRAAAISRLGQQAQFVTVLLTILGASATALTVLLAVLFKAYLIDPLQDITSTTDKIASGKTIMTIPHANRKDEIGKLAQAVQQLQDTTERNRDLQKLELATARERDSLGDKLEANKSHLVAAINNMAHGLIMLDAQANVIVLNEIYRKMYNLPKNIADENCSLRDIMKYRTEVGLFSGDINTYVGTILSRIAHGRPSASHIELKDGRSIRVSEQPMPDGGWVATHEDFTRQRQLERSLERTERFLVTIIENMREAILAKDVQNGRYIFVNRAAEALFGLPRTAIVGRTSPEAFGNETAGRIDGGDRAAKPSASAAPATVQTIETAGNGQRIVAIRHLSISDGEGDGHVLLSLIEDQSNQTGQMSTARTA